MSRGMEDRLRAALSARADEVTAASLRPAEQPTPGSHPGRRRVGPGQRSRAWAWAGAATAVAAAAAVVLGVSLAEDPGTAEPAAPSPTAPEAPPIPVTGSDCRREAGLIERALREPGAASADVDGDGATDRVVTAVDPDAAPMCRAFVGFQSAEGATYSTALDGSTTTPADRVAAVTGVPDLGLDGDADVVVDTGFGGDGQVAQLFSFTGDGLVWVPTAAFEDGSFIVTGGGVTFPRGAACTAAGELVLSMASAIDRGRTYEVTRHVYPATGTPLDPGDPVIETATVRSDLLADRYPEFGIDHWAACS